MGAGGSVLAIETDEVQNYVPARIFELAMLTKEVSLECENGPYLCQTRLGRGELPPVLETGISVLRSRLGLCARPRTLARPSCDQPRLETYANPRPRLAQDVFLRTEFHPPELGTSFSWKRAAVFWVSVPSSDEQLRVSDLDKSSRSGNGQK